MRLQTFERKQVIYRETADDFDSQHLYIDKATVTPRGLGKAIPPGLAANQESDSLVRNCEPEQRVRFADQESEYLVRLSESDSRHIRKSEPMSGVRRIRKSEPAADQEK